KGTFQVKGDRVTQVGIAFVQAGAAGVSLSGGVLSLRYRCTGPAAPVVIDLKLAGPPADAGLIPTQIFTHFADTAGRDGRLEFPLPATPGLTQVKEVVILYGQGPEARAINLSVTGLAFTPTGGEHRAPAR